MAIVAFFELGDDATDPLEVLQDATMDDLLLERAVEAFGDAVGLGFGNQGEAGGAHTPLEAHLTLESHPPFRLMCHWKRLVLCAPSALGYNRHEP